MGCPTEREKNLPHGGAKPEKTPGSYVIIKEGQVIHVETWVYFLGYIYLEVNISELKGKFTCITEDNRSFNVDFDSALEIIDEDEQGRLRQAFALENPSDRELRELFPYHDIRRQ